MKRHLERLVEHMAWADLRALETVRATPVDDAVRLMAHVLTAERLYLARIRGEDPWPQDFWPDLSLDECAALAAATHESLRSYVARSSDASLRESASYRTSRGESRESPVTDMIVHLAMHGEHHRGQVAGLVRAAGGEPALTDFIVWTRERGARPAAGVDAWPTGMPRVGDEARRSREVAQRDIELFTAISGDRNPIHYDEELAVRTRFGGIVVQGGVTSAILNAVVAEDLPGPGTVFLQTSWRFLAPVRPGDTITGIVRVTGVRPDKPVTELETRVELQDGSVVLEGTAVCYTLPLEIR